MPSSQEDGISSWSVKGVPLIHLSQGDTSRQMDNSFVLAPGLELFRQECCCALSHERVWISEVGEVFFQYVDGSLGRDCTCNVACMHGYLVYASVSISQLEPMKSIAWSR